MGDARDPSARRARPRPLVVHLTDDRVLGARHRSDRSDRRRDGLLTAMRMNRLQRGRRLGHSQLGTCCEKCCYGIELAIIDPGSISVYHVAERDSVVR
jgi:hypothetical protein